MIYSSLEDKEGNCMLSLHANSSKKNKGDVARLETDMHCWSSLSLHLTSCFLFLFFPLFYYFFFFYFRENSVCCHHLSFRKENKHQKKHILLKVSQKHKKKKKGKK